MISNSETIPAASSVVGNSVNNSVVGNPTGSCGKSCNLNCCSKVSPVGSGHPTKSQVSPGILTKPMFIWYNPITGEKHKFESLADKYRAHIRFLLDANDLNCNSRRIADILAPLMNNIVGTDLQTFYEHNGMLFESLAKAEAHKLLSS